MSPTFIAMRCHYRPLLHYKCHRFLCKLSSSTSLLLMHAANPSFSHFHALPSLRGRLSSSPSLHWCNQPSVTVMVYFVAISSLSNAANFHCHALSSPSSSSLPCALVVTMHVKCHRVQESLNHFHDESRHLFIDAANLLSTWSSFSSLSSRHGFVDR